MYFAVLMKIFALVFGFYIMYLALLPGLNTLAGYSTHEKETCCAESCGSSEQNPPVIPENENDSCNPFQSCYCCIGFNVHAGFHSLSTQVMYTRSYLHTTEQVPPSLTVDFWQPPKIV